MQHVIPLGALPLLICPRCFLGYVLRWWSEDELACGRVYGVCVRAEYVCARVESDAGAAKLEYHYMLGMLNHLVVTLCVLARATNVLFRFMSYKRFIRLPHLISTSSVT